jgi:hypothetical protein
MKYIKFVYYNLQILLSLWITMSSSYLSKYRNLNIGVSVNFKWKRNHVHYSNHSKAILSHICKEHTLMIADIADDAERSWSFVMLSSFMGIMGLVKWHLWGVCFTWIYLHVKSCYRNVIPNVLLVQNLP